MVVDHRQHHVETIRAAISVLIYPIQYLVNLPVAVGKWMGESVSSRESLREENERLRMQHLLFKAQLQKLSALQVENVRLRELLQSSKKVGENVLIAELLTVDLDPFTRQIVINKGTNDKVYLGQPVLDAEGIMGQIIHAGPFSSTAMLITDPNHAIPVHVNRNGLRAIAVGTGAPDVLEIPYLPNSADIVVGDLLTSSGLGGRFPRDYPVARITQVTTNPTQPYATVTAEPIALLERSREVLLVWPSDKITHPMDTQNLESVAESATETPVARKPATATQETAAAPQSTAGTTTASPRASTASTPVKPNTTASPQPANTSAGGPATKPATSASSTQNETTTNEPEQPTTSTRQNPVNTPASGDGAE